ncbi:MAG: DEAD/DEAH box helicase [Candidatus Heimdallarchaeota archaeon]|nr:DEAD/DEAH box helicase [Candidatus Heimdallarchaeota archaeon]
MTKHYNERVNNCKDGAPNWLKRAYRESSRHMVRYKPITSLKPLSPDNGSMKWSELGLAPPLGAIAAEMTSSDFPFSHQQETIINLLSEDNSHRPIILRGGTGSGKTLAFLLPAISLILQGKIDFVVVFYPMKQLIEDQFFNLKKLLLKIFKQTGKQITTKTYHGEQGLNNDEQSAWDKELLETEQNPPNILLATFDKIFYQLIHNQEKGCLLHNKIKDAKYIVFDEIHALKGLPAAYIHYFLLVHKMRNPTCRLILSTATIAEIEQFSKEFLTLKKELENTLEPMVIESNPVRGTIAVRAIMSESFLPLLTMVEKELPKGTVAFVFVDSKRKIEQYANKLGLKLKKEQAFYDSGKICVLHANLHPKVRKQALIDVREGKVKIVITSAVSELGLNLSNVQTIINVGWPVSGKDGLLQRIARERSKPNEHKVIYLVFDLENPRDKLFYSNLYLIKDILEDYQCTPMLYPEKNQKVITTTIILLLVYGFKNYNEIISFFGRELKLNIEKCLTILLCQAIIQKNGQILSLVETDSKAFKKLIAKSIRAIAENWTINFQEGMDERIIGFFTQEEIIRGGLPGNIILINKIPYLVKSFNSKRRKIGVGLVSIPTTNQSLASNVLTSPKIMMGLFPKKRKLSSCVTLKLGELTVTKRPKLIVKFSLNNSKNSFQYFPPTDSEKIAYTFEDKSFGLLMNIAEVFQDPLLSLFASKTKEMLACLALVLKTQIELTLQIPQSELAIAYNESQFAIYDRGGENGNVQQVFKELQLVVEQAINRLESCSCLDGCEKCYGRDFTKLLPRGKSKMILKQLLTWLMV